MPLYLVEDAAGPKALIYAKTPRGARTAWMRKVSSSVNVVKTTPLEAAVLASKGVQVLDVDGNMEIVMEDDPESARRVTVTARMASLDDVERRVLAGDPYAAAVDEWGFRRDLDGMDLPDGAAEAMSDELAQRLAGDPLDGDEMSSYVKGEEEDENDPNTTAA